MNPKNFHRAAAFAGIKTDGQAAEQMMQYIDEMLAFMAPLAQVPPFEESYDSALDFDTLRDDAVQPYDGAALVPADKKGEDGCYTAPLAVN